MCDLPGGACAQCHALLPASAPKQAPPDHFSACMVHWPPFEDLLHLALSRRGQATPCHWPCAEALAMPQHDSTNHPLLNWLQPCPAGPAPQQNEAAAVKPAPATSPLSSWLHPLALQGPAHREQEAAPVNSDPDAAPGRRARAPKEGAPPASKHSGFYQTVHAGMQGKRHVLLALEIPGKPDHFTVLRPSTGPAVKPMKLDELNSRSALLGWLVQVWQGRGFWLLHACSAASGPVCKRLSWLEQSLACCSLHIWLQAEAETPMHAHSLFAWHGLTATPV